MKELGALMDRAVELAGTDPERRRVETWKKGVWDYMAEGRREYVKKKQAYEKKELPIRIFNTGVDDNHKLLADRAVDSHWRLTQSADDRWKGPNTYAVSIRIRLQLRRGRPLPRPPSGSRRVGDLRGVAKGRYVYEQTFRSTVWTRKPRASSAGCRLMTWSITSKSTA